MHARAQEPRRRGRSPAPAERAPSLTRGTSTLRLGAVGDAAEREADRAAAAVCAGQRASVEVGAAAAVQRRCASCEEEDERIRRQPVAGASLAAGGALAPGLAARIERARGGGSPLPPDVRASMETGFGADFSQVRVHADHASGALARQLGARAFTLGDDLWFGHDAYQPRSGPGRALLAHELAHVEQQRRGGARVQRYACRHLLDATEEAVVSEASVEEAILPRVPSPSVRQLSIPDGSFAAYRDPPRDPGAPGRADIAHLRGSTLELLEIKRADWSATVDAERQVQNYVERGNEDLAGLARNLRRKGVPVASLSGVALMPPTRFDPGSPLRVEGTPTSVSWCAEGVIAFKAIGDQDPGVLTCGPLSSEQIEGWIDRALGEAESMADRLIDEDLAPRLDAALREMPLRDAILLLLRSPASARAVEELFGPESAALWAALPQEAVATLIAEMVGEEGDLLLREIFVRLRDHVLGALRLRARALLRDLIVESLNALCATAAALILSEVLDEVGRRLRQRLLEELPVALAGALALIAVGTAVAVLVAAAAAALIAFFLPEIIAALGLGTLATEAAATTLACWDAIVAFMAGGGGVILQRQLQGSP